MKTICFYFQVHQPLRLRRYRFFDIGNDHYYYDDYTNESLLRKIADRSYLPSNKIMQGLIKEYGSRFKVAFSISGMALDQFELYAPEVIESFQKLAKTDSVEFLAETYSHSLISLANPQEFKSQVDAHSQKIYDLFGQKPSVFRNTELIYSDEIGAQIGQMGFKAMITEGAKHILGWKSPNYLYCNAINPRLKILLRNFKLSDDIAFRFSNQGWSEYPLTTEKYVSWLNQMDPKEDNINVFMDYETFGEHQKAESGIFDFLKALPRTIFSRSRFHFATPSEVADRFQPVAAMNVPYPISWADEERDITAWLGNELQQSTFRRLYNLVEDVYRTNDKDILRDWKNLQTGDHFYYMSTKMFSDGAVHSYFNPYDGPYDAFINFNNVISDFALRVEKANTALYGDTELDKLKIDLAEKEALIKEYESLLNKSSLKPKLKVMATKKATTKGTKAPAKTTAKKTTAKKTVKAAAPKKTTAKKAAPKATAAKKTAAKKPAAKKVTAKKTAAKKTTAAKKVVKKAAPKKTVKKAAKPAAKKAVASKPAANGAK